MNRATLATALCTALATALGAQDKPSMEIFFGQRPQPRVVAGAALGMAGIATLFRHDLMALDLGSRVGSFWDGEPLEPGEAMPLTERGELGLGMSATVEVVPLRGHGDEPIGALLRASTREAWHLFVPQGGPLVLAPGIHVPARILFDRGWVVLDLASGVAAELGRHPLPPGSVVELLVGDRLRLLGAPLTLEVLS